MSQYRAFISYRHSNRDRRVAIWLHKALETYRTPTSLVKTGTRPRAGAIFRDEEELFTNPNLSETIQYALRESEYLIVICSPQSAASKWVNSEISYFCEIGRADRILLLLVEGSPEESFPPELVSRPESTEPLAADIRPVPGSFREKLWPLNRFFRELLLHVWAQWEYRCRRKLELLRILSPLLGCRFDDLRQRELLRMRRRRRSVVVASSLFVALAAFILHNKLQSQILELTSYSKDSLAQDPTRSVLLSRIAFQESHPWLALGGPSVRRTLEEAVYESRLLAQFKTPSAPVQALAWHSSGIIAAGDDGGNVAMWNRTTGRQVYAQSFETGIQKIEFRPGPSLTMAAVVTGSVSRLSGFTGVTIVRQGDRRLQFWNLKSGDVSAVTLLQSTIVTSPADVSWCSDGVNLAASSGLENVSVWNLTRSNAPILVSLPNDSHVNAIKWGNSCRMLYLATPEGLYNWAPDTGQVVRMGNRCGEGHLDTVNASSTIAEGVVALDVRPVSDQTGAEPHEDIIATGGHSGLVCVGDASDTQALTGHISTVTAAAWNHSGTRLATASLDGTVRIWSISENSVQLHQYYGFYPNHGQCWSLAWSPDDGELATTGDDGTVRIWSVVGPSEKRSGARTGNLTMDNDRGLLLDGQPLTNGELEELALERSVRTLTDDECQKYLHGSCRQ